jgi:acetamidase/formamidase
VGEPSAGTLSHYIAIGFVDDLSEAAHKAVRNMIDFQVAEKGLSRDDAYALISVAGDVDVTELVDRNKGVHVMVPKGIFGR